MNIDIAFLVLMLVTFIPLGAIIAFTPYFTRKTELFGVSIPASLNDREDFNQMKKRYALITISLLLVILITLISLSFFLTLDTLHIVLISLLFGYIFGAFIVYLPFHKKMKQIKQEENWHDTWKQTIMIDTTFRDEKLIISNWWYLIPTSITLVITAISFIFYDSVSDTIVQNIGRNGAVTYQAKSIGALLLMPGIQLGTIVLFIFINLIIRSSKQQINVNNPDTSRKQNIVFRRKTSMFLFVMALLTTLLLSLTQIGNMYEPLLLYYDYFTAIYIGIIVLGTIWFAFKIGQGGSRINMKADKDMKQIERDDDVFWKLGQFYFNRNDPAIFIEKRFGLGWTNNWAHPLSWLLIIGFLALCLVPLFFI